MEKELWKDHVPVGANSEKMILMDAVGNLVPPDCRSAHEVRTVSLTYQQVSVSETACLEFLIRHVDRFDLREIESVPLNIRDAKIWTGVCAGSIARRLRNSVGHLGNLT
jgi:hypothetical protein